LFCKNGTLIASGTGQTSRVDALQQAEKAKNFHFDLQGAVMASDAFSLSDCVELAKAGITANSAWRFHKRRIKY
jgi:phosphoribosylaminoimidazolecarboxamide formyltransferase/IMP cyclohydrolase